MTFESYWQLVVEQNPSLKNAKGREWERLRNEARVAFERLVFFDGKALLTRCCRVEPILYETSKQGSCPQCGRYFPCDFSKRFPHLVSKSSAETAAASATRKYEKPVTPTRTEVAAVRPKKPLPGQLSLLD